VATATLTTVELDQAPLDRFRTLLDQDAWRELESTMGRLSAALRGRVLWNVNSTAQGGGVAELLGSIIPYDSEAGIDERWVVIEGSPPFFVITKRLHNMLHGSLTEDLEISAEERRVYDETMRRNAAALVEVVKPGDPIIIHDPQPAGLVPPLARHGAKVIWRSHVGVDAPNDSTRAAWKVLRPYLGPASALVFSRRTYVWEGLDRSRVHVIAPAIDPFSLKNEDLDDKTVGAVLGAVGIVQGPRGEAVVRRAVEARVPRHHELVDPVRALIGEETGDPAAHRRADDVAAANAERVLKLAYEVRQIGKGVEVIAGVARRKGDEVGRQEAVRRAKVVQGRAPVVGAAGDRDSMQQNDRMAGTALEVAGSAVAERDRSACDCCRCHCGFVSSRLAAIRPAKS